MNFFHRILTHLPVSLVFPVLSKLTHTQHKKSFIYQSSIIITNKRRIIQGHHNAKIPARKPGRGFSPVWTLPAESLCLLLFVPGAKFKTFHPGIYNSRKLFSCCSLCFFDLLCQHRNDLV